MKNSKRTLEDLAEGLDVAVLYLYLRHLRAFPVPIPRQHPSPPKSGSVKLEPRNQCWKTPPFISICSQAEQPEVQGLEQREMDS